MVRVFIPEYMSRIRTGTASNNQSNGWTDLHRACYSASVVDVERLIKSGVPISSDTSGRLPHQVTTYGPLSKDATYMKNRAECERLLNPNFREPFGPAWTSLHRAFYEGKEDYIEWLLTNGAIIQQDGNGQFPWQVAVYEPYRTNAEYLQKRSRASLRLQLHHIQQSAPAYSNSCSCPNPALQNSEK